MAVTELDTLLACKMMALIPGYSVAERCIGTGLLEHYNRRTGQCDPGVERLAKLFGYDRRTVLRATTALCDSDLFSKTRHGGRSLRNSYEPNWARFKELHEEWQNRFRGRRDPSRLATNLSPNRGQSGPRTGGATVSQTYSSNLKKEPGSSGDAIDKSTGGSARGTTRHGQAGKELVRRSSPQNRYRSMTTSSMDATLAAAHRKWEADLLDYCGDQTDLYAELVLAIDEDLANRATEVELHRRGAGLRLVLDAVQQPDRRRQVSSRK